MWTQATALLLACCLWPAEAQDEGRQSIWDDPIKFQTKAKDKCTMILTGQGENIKLRLSCLGNRRAYWCEYVGRPYTCSAFNKNPRHYFVQMMWVLRKQAHGCQGPKEIKPHMCRKATDESRMNFSAGPFLRSRPAAQPSKQPGKPQSSAAHGRPNLTMKTPFKTSRAPGKVKTTQRAKSQPTAAPTENARRRMAQQYCWRSLQGVCSFVIGWFRN
ncbi:PREDICTED: fibroblast growth factor-binding protein 2-like [Poecilia mexicana]|uniref:fibroblast growth factor-binding protein 2-like n=1 Tax=Poecilia mexicana TaxID=48701 RepID=UPI00072DA504|nr:PREDICTED: fibroblast growth factor-binding protein 2-like [Poecilia mexicana]